MVSERDRERRESIFIDRERKRESMRRHTEIKRKGEKRDREREGKKRETERKKKI